MRPAAESGAVDLAWLLRQRESREWEKRVRNTLRLQEILKNLATYGDATS